MKIPRDIIPQAYSISKKVYEKKLKLKEGKAILTSTNIVNENSVADYINNFRYLVDGKEFSRTLNAESMDYFIQNIFKDYGLLGLSNALIALKLHIEYIETLHEGKNKSMRIIYDKYYKELHVKSLIVIKDKNQLLNNINTIEFYLTEGTDDDKIKVSRLIKNGICFIAYEIKNEIRFVPSRFIGYVNNSLEIHLESNEKDGRVTNRAISELLDSIPIKNDALNIQYIEYCNKLGIKQGARSNRKFWEYKLETDFPINAEFSEGFPEGRIVERTHKVRERNFQVIELAKQNFKKKFGKLFCQVCKFDFEENYGTDGKDFIEGHHTIAVSDMPPEYKTQPEEIAMLCANCHRMVHKKRPWLTMEKLTNILKK